MTAKSKILVISNDSMLLSFLRQNINGYQLTNTQYTGDELGSVLDKELPDMVILDVMMPNLDGIEVCLRIRQWSQIPILMLSAWGAGEDRVRGLDLSADSYLTEPFGADELLTRIQGVLQQDFAGMNLLSSIRMTLNPAALTGRWRG